MFLFIIAFRLLKGSGLFTHFCFLASSIEHILFTLNKYLLIERRIISHFSISTDTWTLTFLRALIRQVYEGGECCLEIACSPAFAVKPWSVCGLAQACPALLRQSTRGRLCLGHLFWASTESLDHPLRPKLAFHWYRLTVLARLDSSLEYKIALWQYQIADDGPFPIFYNSPYLSLCNMH